MNEVVRSGLMMGAGIRNLKWDQGFRVVLSKRSPTGLRFELARLVGDDLSAGSNDHWLPATSAYTVRQKFQRTFAQEFLCPHKGLLDFFASGEELDEDGIETAAAHYHVSPLLVKSALVNHGQLGRIALTQ